MGTSLTENPTAKTPCMNACTKLTATTPVRGCSCSKAVLDNASPCLQHRAEKCPDTRCAEAHLDMTLSGEIGVAPGTIS
jgi:hypothetical protein